MKHPYDMRIDELLAVDIHDYVSHLSLRQIKDNNIDRRLQDVKQSRDDTEIAELHADIMVIVDELAATDDD